MIEVRLKRGEVMKIKKILKKIITVVVVKDVTSFYVAPFFVCLYKSYITHIYYHLCHVSIGKINQIMSIK